MDQFTIDYSQSRIYFTSFFEGFSIKFCNFFGLNITTIAHLRGRPAALTLNTKPDYRHIYWIEQGNKPRLVMANLDGSNEKTVWANMDHPTDVKYDIWSNRVYWIDVKRKTIEFINVDSIINAKNSAEHYIAWKFNHHSDLSPFKLDIFETMIFVIASSEAKVFALKKVDFQHTLNIVNEKYTRIEKRGEFPLPIYSHDKSSRVTAISILSTLEGLYKFKQRKNKFNSKYFEF